MQVVIHAVFGALLGAGLGALWWFEARGEGGGLSTHVGVGAGSLAILGGAFGDRFWRWFFSALRWWS
jgi:hypothetical protein